MTGHQIVELVVDENDGDVWWRCQCGEVDTGYGSIGEARLAAAEHQLPEPIQREIEATGDTVERWRQDVLTAADDEHAADPAAWQWYRDAATPPSPSAGHR